MEKIKNDDPLLMASYLKTRVTDLKEMAIIDTVDLLPAGLYKSDSTCSYTKSSTRKTVKRYDEIKHPFAIIESEFDYRNPMAHGKPSISFKAGSFSESILFIDGKEITGIATGAWDDGQSVFLDDLSPGRHTVGIHIEADTSYGQVRAKEQTILESFCFSIEDQRIYDIYTHLEILLELYNELPDRDVSKHGLRDRILALYGMVNINSYEDIVQAYPKIRSYIQMNLYQKRSTSQIRAHMVGHAHIDIAWMWDIDKTKRKIKRTFLNQLNLIEKYPHMIFQQGQPYVYKYLKEHEPALYKRIKAAVKTGNIEPVGGIWIESDMNVIGLESLIRQILHGKKFIRDEFGLDCHVLWMPDVFGFSVAVPQVLKKSGITTMMTTKLSWNQNTRFPHDTFTWYSPDGSDVLCHFITLPGEGGRMHTYNGKAELPNIYQTWDEYQQKSINQDLLIPYGYGDGGAGPKERMLDKIDIYSKNLPGFYSFEHSGIESYNDLLLNNVKNKKLPTWHKELYLQLHRGTYSSQSNTKKHNAYSEHLLKSYEKLLVLHNTDDDELTGRWHDYLVQQFHDILPGTSIRKVYQDAIEYYIELESELHKKITGLVQNGKGNTTYVFNPHSGIYRGAVAHAGDYFYFGDLTSHSLTECRLEKSTLRKIEGDVLENEYLKIKINEKDGSIGTAFDKKLKRYISRSYLNRLAIFEDYPITPNKSAWLLEAYHNVKPLGKGIEVNGFQLYECERYKKCTITGTVGTSKLTLEILLFTGSKMIYFDMDIDWQASNTVLKMENHIDVHTDEVTFSSHGCVVKKPNYADVLEEQAQFEHPAQRWADMSDTSYGVSLISDYKYSFSCSGRQLSMILLRSPVSPDETADKGRHKIRYAINPHQGTWQQADAPQVAKFFNEPPLIVEGCSTREDCSLYTIEDDALVPGAFVIEAIKPSEDKKGVIMRGYESKGSSGKIRVVFNTIRIAQAEICNLMEEKEREIKVLNGNALEIPYTPFEIVTIRIGVGD